TNQLPRERLFTVGKLLLPFAALWIGGLWLLDAHFSTFTNPLAHLQYMWQDGFALTRPSGPQGEESLPWQWLLNEVQMTYLRVDQQTLVNGKVDTTQALIYFRGAMNPLIIGAAPLAAAYSAWRAWKFQDRLSFWVVA